MRGLTGPRGDAIEVDDRAWDSAMRINVASMMLMAKYAIPEMMKSGGGSIINLTSIAGLRGGHPSLLYPTSKSAVIGLTRAMAAHHGRDGIRRQPHRSRHGLYADGGVAWHER